MPENIYAAIEYTTCFNFTSLIHKIKDNLLKKYPTTRGESFIELMHKNLRPFTINDQQFEYACAPNHLGGYRWFVKCPKCGDSCLKLYLPTKYKNREQKYYCKHCHKLKNISLLLGNSKRYRLVVKPLKRLEKLRFLLLKKGMTPDKAQPMLDEYKKIEQELAACPEYRLWRFQKEHGIGI
jgi:hypothetical protein